MENSIEAIWKEGFLNERSLVAPKINDLYNKKSIHAVDRVEKMFRINLAIIIITAILFPVVYYFIGFFWQGTVASVLLLLTAWYSKRLTNNIKTLDHGSTSFDYLKSFNQWLKDALSRSEEIARFSYPLYFLIAINIIWSAWNEQGLTLIIQRNFPDLIITEHIPLIALIIAGVSTLLMFLYSGKIYRWEVRLMYGRVFNKLEETIAEMEKLKEGN